MFSQGHSYHRRQCVTLSAYRSPPSITTLRYPRRRWLEREKSRRFEKVPFHVSFVVSCRLITERKDQKLLFLTRPKPTEKEIESDDSEKEERPGQPVTVKKLLRRWETWPQRPSTIYH